MKKKKKLALHRETIRNLAGGDLGQAAGRGALTVTINTSCHCDAPTGCDCATLDTDCYSPTMCAWGCSISAQTCRC